NKINFQGMSGQKVRALAAQLHDKIRQYLSRSEGAYLVANRTLAAAHELLERYRDDELSPAEHLYYILLGNAFAQYRRFEAKERKEATNANEFESKEETP